MSPYVLPGGRVLTDAWCACLLVVLAGGGADPDLRQAQGRAQIGGGGTDSCTTGRPAEERLTGGRAAPPFVCVSE